MMDEPLIVKKEYDFFIYCRSDSCEMGQQIASDLERDYRCLKSWDHKHGSHFLDELHKDVQRSCWTLICLPEGSEGDPEQDCHAFMAGLVEKEYPSITFVTTPETCNTLENCLWANTGQMSFIHRVIIDFNRQDYLGQILNTCYFSNDAIGCLAHGQVFSHFIGFWRYILPDLEEKIKDSSWYKDNPRRMSTKLFVMLPGHANMDDLETVSQTTGTRITHTREKLDIKVVCHAGKERKYSVDVYEVSNGSQSFYCVVDLPDVLRTICLMDKHGIEGVQWASEILRFYYTVSMLVNHSQFFPDKVRLLLYNEKAANKADVLFNAVRTDVLGEVSGGRQVQPPDRLLSRCYSQYEHQVAVIRDPSVDEDEPIVQEITDYLKSKQVNTCPTEKPSLRGLNESKWHIFIVSRQSMEHQFMRYICRCSLSCDEIHAIFILRDVMPYELPPEMKWAFVLSVSEPKYMEKLLKAMDGEPVRLENSLPTGDVATGLAWGYAVRYLNLTLGMGEKNPQAFTNRIQEFCRKESMRVGQGCVNRFYSLCPKSCTTTDTVLVEEVNKRKSKTRYVEPIGTLEEYRYKSRTYKLHVYKYTNLDRNMSLCFVCEYNTPLNCLSEMANNYKFAGLLKEDMYRQCERFVKLLPNILAHPRVKEEFGNFSDLVQLVYFDDEKQHLMDVLEEILQDPSAPIVTGQSAITSS